MLGKPIGHLGAVTYSLREFFVSPTTLEEGGLRHLTCGINIGTWL
ncbi:MAG: hypothetical protein ACFWT6_17890 [Virgibacillus proomii]